MPRLNAAALSIAMCRDTISVHPEDHLAEETEHEADSRDDLGHGLQVDVFANAASLSMALQSIEDDD